MDRRNLFFILLAFFGVIYTVQVVANHYFMRTYALDYAYYNQAFWDFAHFRVNANTVFEPPLENFFQIHPGFTLLILSPLYYLLSPVFGTYSLLILQNVFIIIGGIAVYKLIFRMSQNFWIALLAFLHYNLIWGHFSALSSDFIETTVAASMVPVFLLLFDTKKFLFASLVFLFIIVCKENMPIWMIFISFFLILFYKDSGSRRMAGVFAALSFLYLVVLFKIVIPFFERPGTPYWGFSYSALGSNPAEALGFIIRHPWESFRLLFINHSGDPVYDGIKQEFYIVFLISGGILLILRPLYFIPFIPVIAQKMLNDSYSRWGILGFYSIEVVSILTVFVFMSTGWIKNVKLKYLLLGILCLSTLWITLNKMNARESKWYDRRKEAFLRRDFYQSELNVKEIRKQIQKYVPDDAPFVATHNILPHFSFRDHIHIFPYIHDAVYMALLKNVTTYPLTREQYNLKMNEYMQSPDWATIFNDDELVILKKK